MKKKIFIAALAICLVVVSIAGSSLAYFTDEKQYTNTFTAGNVEIKLTVNGTEVNESTFNTNNTEIYPGLTLKRDVTITNTGSEDAYVGAIITLTDTDGNLGSVIAETGGTDNIPVAITTFLTGIDASVYDMEVVSLTNGSVTIGYEVYLVKKAAVSKDGTAVVFKDIVIPTEWNNTEVAAFKDMTLDVKAYAVQTKGMDKNGVAGDNALEALAAAFESFKTILPSAGNP